MKLSRLIGLAVAIFAVIVVIGKLRTPAVVVTLPDMSTVSEFTLTNQQGEAFSSKTLHGKVWVADFFFTNCPGPCPLLTSSMAELHKAFASNPEFAQVSITIDPTHDTPAELSAYAAKHSVDTARWTFLTGELDDIITTARDVFKVSADRQPELHTTRFILVDQHGKIRGYYDGTSPEEMAKLQTHVRALLTGFVPTT